MWRAIGVWGAFCLGMWGMIPTISAEDKAEDSAKTEKAEEQPEEKKKDRFEVPKGDVKELLTFIDELRSSPPKSRREFMQLQMAITTAAERILEQEKDTTSKAYRTAKIILLTRQVSGLITKSAEERAPIIKEVEAFLEGDTLSREQLQLGMQAARALEYGDETAGAVRIYEKIGRTLAKSEDPEMAERGKMFLGSARRLGLVGKPMELSGETFEGKPFRLQQLSNKVVLVDFWATWCGPCIGEIPSMKKMYAGYHDKGFEIVGVSLDSDREALAEFLEERKLPWIILHDEKHNGEHPAAQEYGVSGIPCMILIGRDGNVLSIHARGEALEELLAKEFGPLPEEKKPAEEEAEKPASSEKKAE
jgi:thiol-disulfide isomerase/thioredoxin